MAVEGYGGRTSAPIASEPTADAYTRRDSGSKLIGSASVLTVDRGVWHWGCWATSEFKDAEQLTSAPGAAAQSAADGVDCQPRRGGALFPRGRWRARR